MTSRSNLSSAGGWVASCLLGLRPAGRPGGTGTQPGLLVAVAEAVTCSRKGVAATSAGHRDRSARLAILGAALHEQLRRTGDDHVLNDAVATYGVAGVTSPHYNAEWAGSGRR